MVFQQNLLEKAYFVFKITGLAIVRPASSDFWKEPLVLNFLVFDPLLSRLQSVSCRLFVCFFLSFSRRLKLETQKGQTSSISYVNFKVLDKFESSCKARVFFFSIVLD